MTQRIAIWRKKTNWFQECGAFARRFLSNKRPLWAVGGATIVLFTFLAKDAERDHLKDLVDSIDSAENAFILRSQNRATIVALKKFRDEFREFREHPTVAVPHNDGGGSSDFDNSKEVDWEMVYSCRSEELSNQELLDSINRLARKLPENGTWKATESSLESLKNKPQEFWDQWYKSFDQAMKTANVKSSLQLIQATNNEIFKAHWIAKELSDALDNVSQNIVTDSEKERTKAEALYGTWLWVTYVFYVLGWIMTILAIFFEREEESFVQILVEE